MKIHSVKLINYKSIGDYKASEIIIEPRVTAIIGKNESGKSNVLEGLSNINFTKNMRNIFKEDSVNRKNSSDAGIKYIITLKATQEEKDIFGILEDTIITVTLDSYDTTGGIVSYYKENIKPFIDDLVNLFGNNPFKLTGEEFTKYTAYISILKKDDSLNIIGIDNAIVTINSWISARATERKEVFTEKMGVVREKWPAFKVFLPTMFYRKTDKILNTQYRLEDVKKELNTPTQYPNSLLHDLVKLLGLSTDDFILAVGSGVAGRKATIRDNIKESVEKVINQEFYKFYSAEPTRLGIAFDSNTVYFSVKSSYGDSMLLSERSDGLRWYLNTFIDTRSNGISESNVVYLFDEPGTSLHVNAQKELLKLFNDLASKGNQVVYTTHSPYMLDTENNGIHRIRAVEKDEEGYTYIHKTAYDASLNEYNKKDTLTPIISAIGMSLQDTFGPAQGKLNIVTEGVSDFIYLHTMAKVLDFDLTKYSFIPSIGVTNSLNICAILHGWGCPYMALFDYDTEGVEKGGEVLRNKFQYTQGKEYLFIKDVPQQDIDEKTYKTLPIVIEDIVTQEEIDRFKRIKDINDGNSKTLLAKLFSNAVEEGTYIYGEECRDNFKALFDRIAKCCKKNIDL